MYDITNEESFTQVKKIKTEIEKELNKKDVPMALVAMKTDLESQVIQNYRNKSPFPIWKTWIH